MKKVKIAAVALAMFAFAAVGIAKTTSVPDCSTLPVNSCLGGAIECCEVYQNGQPTGEIRFKAF